MPSQTQEPALIDGRLRLELRELADRLRARRLHARSARLWALFLPPALIVTVLAWAFPGAALWAFFGLACGAAALSVRIGLLWQREPGDFEAAARAVEAAHPELAQALRTALQQRPAENGSLNFLQRRLIARALDHALSHDWRLRHRNFAPWPQMAHAAALLACAGIFGLAFLRPPDARSWSPFSSAALEVDVSPGDAEIERGSTVVVAVRFGGETPRSARLEASGPDGILRILPMARSHSDPVFAVTLPAVAHDVVYRIDHHRRRTRDYRLAVFDLPSLVRADASLDYPDYTGLETTRIEDTRRVSAVEGTHLGYEFAVNKPLQRAALRSESGEEIELAPNDDRTRFTMATTLAQSARFTLHLQDDSGRVNAQPPDIRIEVLPNQRPELRLAFPRGDVRVSPLEEVVLQATARDDFALLDYGVGFSVGDAPPQFVSTRACDDPSRAAGIEHLLALEPRGAQPGDLVAWFPWADDHGPDGEARRTTGELFFGEVRPFDEIFREAEANARQNQPGGNQGGEGANQLLELQRQISLAIWKLRQESTPGPEFEADVASITDGQTRARARLAQAAGQLEDERQRAAAQQAERYMTRTGETLEKASDARSLDPLAEAWTNSQGAYQALLRMQPREARVAQQRGASGQNGGDRGNQRQLNQLRFRSADDRYETESEAQALTTPEERAQLQVLARLRELARRQQDVNERLQELQTALDAAADEAERDRIRRELRRLEEEQQRMVADLDDVRQRLDRQPNDENARQARQQLDQTREQMRRSREALQQGAVSRALASGTRAREELDQARDDLRRKSASRFSEQLREMRRTARDLATEQTRIERELEQEGESSRRSLDDSGKRQQMAERMDRQREGLDGLLRGLRDVTKESEEAEPMLHRQLYDVLREQGQRDTADRMRTGAELLRRGFLEQTRTMQPEVTQRLEQLRRDVERAAESVLGDEASTLRFAQRELDDLTRAVRPGAEARPESGAPSEDTRPAAGPPVAAGSPASEGQRRGEGSPPAPGGGEGQATDELTRAIESLAGEGRGTGASNPLTGGSYGEWSERLRTVESLLELPGARERLSTAREQAGRLRAEYRRHGETPQWGLVESGIVAPLSEVRGWVREELARQDDPQALQPVDRDPVPERFAEAVRKYYEALGR